MRCLEMACCVLCCVDAPPDLHAEVIVGGDELGLGRGGRRATVGRVVI